MESEQQALVRTIRAHPQDDAPRLIYADWLDENHEPDLAELIRLSMSLPEIRRAARTTNDYLGPAQDETTLRYMVQRRFLGETGRIIVNRGLVEEVVVYRNQLANFPPYLPVLMQYFPVTRLEITGANVRDLATLLAMPAMNELGQLAITMECDDATKIARCLRTSPNLAGLTRLELREIYALFGHPRVAFPNDQQVVSDAEIEQLHKRFGAALVWRDMNPQF